MKYASLTDLCSLPGLTARPVGGWLSHAYVDRAMAVLDAEVQAAEPEVRAEVVRRAAASARRVLDAWKYGVDWFASEEPWR